MGGKGEVGAKVLESTVVGKAREFPDWQRPRKGSPKMFENPVLERLSRVHPATPLVLYVPLVCFLLWKSVGIMSAENILVFFLLGVFVWTLTEYSLHRFVFHFVPNSKLGRRLHFIIHGVHHMYPWDYSRLVMPPSVSLILAVIFWSISKVIFGDFAYSFFAGMTTGYLIYDMTHYSVHRFKAPKNRFLRKIWQNHLKHHFTNPNARFGVSSPFWDIVFRTYKD